MEIMDEDREEWNLKKIVSGLIKRDCCILLHQWKRMLVYCGSIFILDVILLLYAQTFTIKYEILGVTVEKFLSDPEKMPLQWIWVQIGILLISIDFIRKDFCEHTSCFLPHIKKRSLYWCSKMLCGGILALGLSVFLMAEKLLVLFLGGRLGNAVEVTQTMLFASCVLTFLGMCTLYWLYSLVSLMGNEIAGLTVCLAYVVLGLPINMPLMYCNSFMYARGNLFMAFVVAGVVLAGSLIIGIARIRRMDILGK